MYSLPGDWGLPPGTSEHHIEERFGGPDYCRACEGTGKIQRSDCCDIQLVCHEDDEELTCECCGEPAEAQECDRCNGTGEEPDALNG